MNTADRIRARKRLEAAWDELGKALDVGWDEARIFLANREFESAQEPFTEDEMEQFIAERRARGT